jgi:hypothetical protein
MQSEARINQQSINAYAECRRALNDEVQRMLTRFFGCWHHQLSRPFTQHGKSWRICLKCGMSRDFDLETWTTYGPYRQRN